MHAALGRSVALRMQTQNVLSHRVRLLWCFIDPSEPTPFLLRADRFLHIHEAYKSYVHSVRASKFERF